MRGDQLARQWRVIRGIEASSNGLTVAEIANREETGIRTIYRDLEALQAAGFPLYTEKVERATRWAFIDTFKFKIPPPFALTELMSLYFYKDLVRVFKGTPFQGRGYGRTSEEHQARPRAEPGRPGRETASRVLDNQPVGARQDQTSACARATVGGAGGGNRKQEEIGGVCR